MRLSAGGALVALLFSSCIYKAGRRSTDINYLWETTISPYYTEKYMKSLDSFYPNRLTITSEIVNYPERFVPVTDSTEGLKYVIEFPNFDSIVSLKENYLTLASIYDFKKGRWITNRDSLRNNELNKFRRFFRDSVLAKTVSTYRGIVPDSLLFTTKDKAIALKPLQ